MRAVLDACVLYPTVLRQILIGCAEAGLIVPLWSDRILGEWRLAVARTHPDQAAQVGVEIALLTSRFPAAVVPADPALEARLSLPDDNDRHVLATAISGSATDVITLNMRDFPGRVLARDDIFARHPDGVVMELLADRPDAVKAVIREVTAPVLGDTRGDFTQRSLLKKASLPRTAKCLG